MVSATVEPWVTEAFLQLALHPGDMGVGVSGGTLFGARRSGLVLEIGDQFLGLPDVEGLF